MRKARSLTALTTFALRVSANAPKQCCIENRREPWFAASTFAAAPNAKLILPREPDRAEKLATTVACFGHADAALLLQAAAHFGRKNHFSRFND